jgi:two-component system phosphate regulon response regulator PhoB
MKKVLIVEDNVDLRALVRMTLELEDFELHEAKDGQVGLDMAKSIKPDLVVLDVMMPELDGLQVCRGIRADASLKHTRVMLLSARGQIEDHRLGFAAGADRYLVKPFSPAGLRDAVAEIFDNAY